MSRDMETKGKEMRIHAKDISVFDDKFGSVIRES